MGLYEMPLSMSLMDLGIGTMLTTFHMCGITVVDESSFKHAREECESKRA